MCNENLTILTLRCKSGMRRSETALNVIYLLSLLPQASGSLIVALDRVPASSFLHLHRSASGLRSEPGDQRRDVAPYEALDSQITPESFTDRERGFGARGHRRGDV